MKHVLSFFLFLATVGISTAQEYYWVGGTGNWSDFSNHWATSSGGTTFHTSAPTIADSVYFDVNSFTTADQEMTVDVEAFCANMDWTGTINSPTWRFSSQILRIGGSLTLIADMEMSYRNIYFDSDDLGNTLKFADKELKSLDLRFYGSGSWILQDSLRVNEIRTFDDALLDLNDQYSEIRSLYPAGASVIDLGSSEVYTVNLRNSSSAIEPIIPGTSKLYVNNSFYAGGGTYNWVVLQTPFVSQVTLRDDMTIDTLEIAKGSTVSLESGTTLTVNQLIASGTKAEDINLFASTVGSAATISQASGEVDAEYLVIQDITGDGGATFSASNTIDNGNNTGWTIAGLIGSNYYWVGGAGSWSVFSSHWATTSNGSTMHMDAPGQLDSVFFDANSFTEPASVILDIDASCANMDWSSVTESVVFETTASEETLNIYGSLILSANVSPQLDDVHLLSEDMDNELITGDQSLGVNSKLWLSGDGAYTLTGSLDVYNLEMEAGSFDLNDQNVNIRRRFTVSGSEAKILDFGASEIRTNDYFYTTSGLTLDAGTSKLILDGNGTTMRGNPSGDISYHQVVVDGTAEIDQYDHSFFSLEITAGSRLSIGGEDTLTMTHFIANGTLADSIEIKSTSSGTQGVLEVAAGIVEGSYLKLQDIDALGGATFNAFESKDDGNVTGWNFLEDETAPSFEAGFPKLDSIAGMQVFFEAQADEPSTIYYIAVASGSTTPAALQVKLGTDSNDAPAFVSGSASLSTADEVTPVTVSGLEEEVSYDFYFILEDGAENLQATVEKISASTIDTSAPEFTDDFPQTASVGAKTFELDVSLQEEGTVYYVVVENDAAAPSPIQVQAGTDAADASAIASGLVDVPEIDQEYRFEVAGLVGETEYDVYLITEDADENVSATTQLLELTTDPEPKNYYWVGGTGNWSEFSTHWATTSSGTTFYDTVPTVDDNVFFDANSFSSMEQSVTIDGAAFCRDMDWTGVENTPVLNTSTNTLTLSGSLTLVAEMTMNHRSLYFESDDDGRFFKTANLKMENLDIRLYGSGELQVVDSLFVDGISIFESSKLDLNDQYVEIFALSPFATSVVELTSSSIYATNFRVSSTATEPVIAGTSKLYVSNSFHPSDANFNVVTLQVPFDTQVSLEDDFSADSLVLEAGTSINFEPGTTISLNQLMVEGTKTDSISLYTSSSGSQVALLQTSGEVNAEYAIMQDIAVSGGASFIADQSIDLGNNTGWTFLADETAPIFAESYPKLDSVASTYARISANVDEPVNLSYVVTISGASAPSASQVLAGTDASDVPAVLSGEVAITRFDAEVLFEITGLDIETSYELFFAIEDEAGNVQAVVEQLSITTTEDPEAKEDQTITFADDLTGLKYGDGTVTLTAVSSASLVITYTVTGPISVEGPELIISGAGEATVTANQTGNDDFNAAEAVVQTFTISKAVLIAIPDDQQITFGDEVPALTISYADFVGEDTISDLDTEPIATTSATSNSNVGAYDIISSGGTDDDYSYDYQTGTLTIAKANQTITFEAIDGIDLITNNTINLSATASSGLGVNFSLVSGDGEIADGILTANSSGNFEVQASQAGNGNYNAATSVSQNFQVTDSRKSDQTITFETIDDQVYGDDLTLVGNASSGLPLTYNLTSGNGSIDGNTLAIVGVGEYEVTASQSGDAGFNPAPDVVQSFSVSKALLIATANDQSMQEGAELPELAISYSGFKRSDDVSTINEQPSIATTATIESEAGTYEITLSGGVDDTYDFTLQNGTLTIEAVLGLDDQFSVKFYPNPTPDRMLVETDDFGSLEILDLQGKSMLKANTHEISLSDLANGTFLLVVRNRAGEVIAKRKLIKN